MRSEQEIMDLILEIAQKDDKIKAVYMNGSRTNPNVPKDIFQDYDIVYVVTDTKPYIEDKGWPDRFGEVWFMQYPDEGPYYPSDKENSYGWLMQFKDGVRIDLTVKSIPHALENIKEDKLCKIILDKNHILPAIPEATDEDYYVAKPNQEQFKSTCNEFWWCLNNVGKGLWRNELPYANDMLNFVIRKMLERMLCWQVGVTTDFTVSTGKSAKYMYKWIPDNDYNHYLRTYSCGSVEECWNSVFLMTDLFGKYARIVSEAMGFVYNEGEEVACLTYLKLVQKLPKDANEVC